MLSTRDQWTHLTLLTEIDVVLGWCIIPPRATLHGGGFSFKLVATNLLDHTRGIAYGLSAYLLPILDMDNPPDTPKLMWDTQVPKAETMASNILDIDQVTTADTTTVVSGESATIDINTLVGIGKARRLFRHQEMLTFADNPTGFVTGTPPQYIPTKYFRKDMPWRFTAPESMPYAMLIGYSNLSVIDQIAEEVSANHDQQKWVPNTDHEWMALTDLDLSMQQVKLAAVGELSTTFADEISETIARQLRQAHMALDGQTSGEVVLAVQEVEVWLDLHLTVDLPTAQSINLLV